MSDERQGAARYEIVLTEALAPRKIAAVAKRAARATRASPERLQALLERGPGTLARTDSATQAEAVARAFRDAGAEVVARPPRTAQPPTAPSDTAEDTGVTDDPVADDPVADDPIVNDPVANDPIVNDPVDKTDKAEKAQARRLQTPKRQNTPRQNTPRQQERASGRPSSSEPPQSSDRQQHQPPKHQPPKHQPPKHQPPKHQPPKHRPPTAEARADSDASPTPDSSPERTAAREGRGRQEARATKASPRASRQASKRAPRPSSGSSPSSSRRARPKEAEPRRAAPAASTSSPPTRGSWLNTLLVAFLCLVIGVTGGYVAGSNADALNRLLSGAVATLLGQNDAASPTSPTPPADVVTTAMRRDYLADEIDLAEIEARYDASLRTTPVATVTGTVTNLGSRRVAVLFVTAYFLGPGEQTVAEETYPAVLSSAFTTSREGPLLPGETRPFSFTADDVPGRWQEGEVRVEATDIDFE